MPKSKKREAARENRVKGYLVGGLRLGLYDPLEPDIVVEWIDAEYQDTEVDHRAIRRVVDNFNSWSGSRPDVTLCMGVYPAEAAEYGQRAAS